MTAVLPFEEPSLPCPNCRYVACVCAELPGVPEATRYPWDDQDRIRD